MLFYPKQNYTTFLLIYKPRNNFLFFYYKTLCLLCINYFLLKYFNFLLTSWNLSNSKPKFVTSWNFSLNINECLNVFFVLFDYVINFDELKYCVN